MALRDTVYRANRSLAATGLVHGTFGNVSVVDRKARVFMNQTERRTVCGADAEEHGRGVARNGEGLGGKLRPSSDTPTHLGCISPFRQSARSSTPTRSTPPYSPRLASRSAAWARRTRTTFTATFR